MKSSRGTRRLPIGTGFSTSRRPHFWQKLWPVSGSVTVDACSHRDGSSNCGSSSSACNLTSFLLQETGQSSQGTEFMRAPSPSRSPLTIFADKWWLWLRLGWQSAILTAHAACNLDPDLCARTGSSSDWTVCTHVLDPRVCSTSCKNLSMASRATSESDLPVSLASLWSLVIWSPVRTTDCVIFRSATDCIVNH
jgi:hypothetical protein